MVDLVFEGCGVKAIAYAGALKAIEENNLTVDRLAGVSSGAIAACIIGAGYRADDIINIFSNMDFRYLLDSSPCIVSDAVRLVFQYGWNKGDWIIDKLASFFALKNLPRSVTFEQFPKYLAIVGTDVTNGQSVIFSPKTSPRMEILTAVRISIAYPFLFRAVKYDNRIWVDGGLLNNYPINIWDENGINCKTIGLKTSGNPGVYGSRNIIEYTENVASILINHAQKVHLSPDDWKRTIWIDCGLVSAFDPLSKEDMRSLFYNGYNAAKYRLANWWTKL